MPVQSASADVSDAKPKRIVDVVRTETFFFDLAVEISDVLLFVTTDFNWLEQQALMHLQQAHAACAEGRRKQLRVVYDFSSNIVPDEALCQVCKQVGATSEERCAQRDSAGVQPYDCVVDSLEAWTNSEPRIQNDVARSRRTLKFTAEFARTLNEVLSNLVFGSDQTGKLEPPNLNVSFHSSGSSSPDLPGGHFAIESSSSGLRLRTERVVQGSIPSSVAEIHDMLESSRPNVFEMELADGTTQRIFELEVPGIGRDDITIVKVGERYVLEIQMPESESKYQQELPSSNGLWNWKMDDSRFEPELKNGVLFLRAGRNSACSQHSPLQSMFE
jgi:hypothetical protein